jgi:hypothetical protein
VGGAAMALAYDAARVTRDVDAMFKPHGIVHEEALNRRCQSAPVWQAVIVIYPAQAINGYRQRRLHTVSAVVISTSSLPNRARRRRDAGKGAGCSRSSRSVLAGRRPGRARRSGQSVLIVLFRRSS